VFESYRPFNGQGGVTTFAPHCTCLPVRPSGPGTFLSSQQLFSLGCQVGLPHQLPERASSASWWAEYRATLHPCIGLLQLACPTLTWPFRHASLLWACICITVPPLRSGHGASPGPDLPPGQRHHTAFYSSSASGSYIHPPNAESTLVVSDRACINLFFKEFAIKHVNGQKKRARNLFFALFIQYRVLWPRCEITASHLAGQLLNSCRISFWSILSQTWHATW